MKRAPPSLTLLLVACGGGPPAFSGPTSPPLTTPTELIDLHDGVRVTGLDDRRFDHETYWRAVRPYIGGSVAGRVAGTSAEGREILHLTFGDGTTHVLLWSQMHGNESTASMALADITRFFHDAPDHPLAQRIAAGSTVHMIPMLNPDGAERFQRVRLPRIHNQLGFHSQVLEGPVELVRLLDGNIPVLFAVKNQRRRFHISDVVDRREAGMRAFRVVRVRPAVMDHIPRVQV